MSRTGRKRKAGARYPSGKLKPSGSTGAASTKPHAAEITGTEYQRLITNAKQMLKDDLLATQLGRLNRLGELSAPQTVAGFRIGEIYGAYERWHGVRRSARSPSYNASFGEASVHEDLLPQEVIDAREAAERRATEAFTALQNHILLLPREVRAAVEMLCVEDYYIGPVLLEPVRRFLAAMAQRWPDRTGSRTAAATATRRRHDTAVPEKQKPKRPNHDRAALRELVTAMRPDLEPDDVDAVFDYFLALKARAALRTKVPARSAAAVKPVLPEAALTGHPVLTLTEDAE